MSLLYLAASLRKFGHEPIIYDLGVFTGTNEEGLKEIAFQAVSEHKPELVGFTCSSSSFPFVIKSADYIKKSFPNLKIVIGGMHPTLFPREILENCSAIDYIAIGEADNSIVKLCDRLDNKEIDSIVPGMAQRTKEGKIVIGERLELIKNLDDLPMPAWQDIAINDYHFDYSGWLNPKKHKIDVVAPILTSRSCPFDCNFCAFNTLMGRGFRYHSPERVVDEIEKLHKQFGVNYFEFIDDNIGIKKSRLIAICNEILKRNLDIQFTSMSGLHIATLDQEVINALCDAGYLHAILPVEHASDFIRNKVIGKKLSRRKIFEVAELFKKRNIMTRGFFIIGFPEETEQTIKETIQMIKELDFDLVNVFNLIPFPGTRLFQQCLEHKLFLNKVDTNTLWKGELGLDTSDRSGFYLKPLAMSMEKLMAYRQEIDQLVHEKQQQTQLKIKTQSLVLT
ncbi:MAG: radical SAM protein [Candidatus Parabeggiatoa sp.]|nr:radical SAM protein [Candidatus Parabeggiatoa sp.]